MTTEAEVRERQKLEDAVPLAFREEEGATSQGTAGSLSKLGEARKQVLPRASEGNAPC